MVTVDDGNTAAERRPRSAIFADGYKNVGFESIGGYDRKSADCDRTKCSEGKNYDLYFAF